MSHVLARSRAGLIAGALMAVSGTAAHGQEFINILTGGTSGVYYPLGVALSQLYAKAVPNAKTAVQATKASAENLNLLEAGRGENGCTLGDTLAGGGEVGAEAPELSDSHSAPQRGPA